MVDIKEIHERGELGTIVEMGAGVPIAEKLTDVPGASGTVFETFSPYHKTAQNQLASRFGVSLGQRHVSAESAINLCRGIKAHQPDQFVLVSTWQVSGVDDSVVTHGWIAYTPNDTSTFAENTGGIVAVHVTIPRRWMFEHPMELTERVGGHRAEKIDLVGEIGLELIAARGNLNELTHNCFIDDIEFGDRIDGYLRAEMLLDLQMKPCLRGNEHMLTFKAMRPVRMVSVMTEEPLLIFKGSFNPLIVCISKLLKFARLDLAAPPH